MIGLLFDMDGVLVDNHHYHIVAYLEWARKYGYEISEEVFNTRLTGKTMRDAILELTPELLEKNTLEFYEEEKESKYRELYLPHMKTTAGLIPFLDEAKAAGAKIACGSNAYMKNIDFILDGCHLRKYFSAAVSGVLVPNPKPAPDVYLKAAELIGVAPKDAIVFEDSLTGIKAAKAAGIKVIGVASALSHAELSHTDFVIKDFTELSMEKIREVLAQ